MKYITNDFVHWSSDMSSLRGSVVNASAEIWDSIWVSIRDSVLITALDSVWIPIEYQLKDNR